MLKISISAEIKQKCPQTSLGIIHYHSRICKSSPELIAKFNQNIEELVSKYTVEDIAKRPHIQSTRTAYKALGKDFYTYRNSAEAMLRRIIKSKGLYFVNDTVDINNIISTASGYSLGAYDLTKTQGPIELKRAADGEKYLAIGKEAYNIEYLPTLYDNIGAFGNPSSDSQRTMISNGEHEIILLIYSFDGNQELDEWLDKTIDLLARHTTNFHLIDKFII